MDENKIILIDKPAGISSFGVVARVRRELTKEFGHKVKVGHTGTLDPFATGLLILLSGQYTKKSSEFLKLDKIYDAKLRLGFVSSTGDPEGEITETISSEHGERRDPERNVLESAIQSFIGQISQTVPRFSAVKINGQRAYKLARKGADFTPPTREVTIYNIDILEYNYPTVKIRVHCSSGTYIRTLAEDIGKKLGTGAYLTALRRIQIGDYNIKDARPCPNVD